MLFNILQFYKTKRDVAGLGSMIVETGTKARILKNNGSDMKIYGHLIINPGLKAGVNRQIFQWALALIGHVMIGSWKDIDVK